MMACQQNTTNLSCILIFQAGRADVTLPAADYQHNQKNLCTIPSTQSVKLLETKTETRNIQTFEKKKTSIIHWSLQ